MQTKRSVQYENFISIHYVPFHYQVEEVTQVPRGHQKILHKGRNLVNSSSNLSQLGIGQGAKVMILGKIDPQKTGAEEEDKECEAVRKVGKMQLWLSRHVR